MQLRLFPTPDRPVGPRLKNLVSLPELGFDEVVQGAIDLAATDDPLVAKELVSGFVGKLPIWLDLDSDPAGPARLGRRAKKAIAAADVVTVATRGLWEIVREHRHRVFLVPDPIPPTPSPKPATMPLLRPALGYCGANSVHLQGDLLVEIAATKRDYQVYIGGPAADRPEFVAADATLPNFHRLPEADPSLWRRLSVAVFPFEVDKATETWLPHELLTALRAGAPIICTPLLEVGRTDLPVSFATSADGFIARAAELMADAEQCGARIKRGQAFIAEEHDPKQVAARLQKALAGVVRG